MLKEKWKNDKLGFERISNEKLDCRNCKFKFDDSEMFGNTSKCEVFTLKPIAVIKGGKCSVKEKE